MSALKRTPGTKRPDQAQVHDRYGLRTYRTPTPTAAAWAPMEPPAGDSNLGQPQRASLPGRLGWYLRREPLAIAWLEERREADQIPRRALRVTFKNEADGLAETGDPSIDRMVRAWLRAANVVSNRDRHLAGGYATYAPQADDKTLAGAMFCADAAPLVVTESPLLPLKGWVGAMGAIDLRTGQVTPDERTDEQRDRLNFLLNQTYNGWKVSTSRSILTSLCAQLADLDMTWEVFIGSVLAQAPDRFDLAGMKKLAPAPWRATAAHPLPPQG